MCIRDRLKQLAKIDSLTGLFNRAYAKRALDTILNNEADASQNYALLVFDIDFFKSANDEFGHLFGDQVLANVAHRIQANVRKSDISARIGGDEFLIFMEYKDHLEQMIERIFQALNGSFQGYDITVSMGAVSYTHLGAAGTIDPGYRLPGQSGFVSALSDCPVFRPTGNRSGCD